MKQGKQAGKERDERRDARTKRGTRRGRRYRAGIDSGRVAIGFPPVPFSSAHPYHQSPRLSSRLVVPACLPGFIVPPGSLVPRPASPPCRYAPALVSSSHPVISSARRFLSSSRRGLSPINGGRNGNGRWRATGDGGGRSFFSCAPFSSAHYRSPRYQALPIGAAYDRCGSDGAVSTVSSHHLIRSSSHTPPIAPGSSSHRHLMGAGSVSPVVSSYCVSSRASRPVRLVSIYPGHHTGAGRAKASKRTRKNGDWPGRQTGEQDGAKNGTHTTRRRERARTERGRRASRRQREHATITHKTIMGYLLSFRPTPS